MKDAELEALLEVGFSRPEATSYLLLLQDYPATAYEVSKRGGLTKAGVYAALVSLERKGAVQPVTQSPVRYAPVDPERFFGTMSSRLTNLCGNLATTLSRSVKSDDKEYVWSLAGEAHVDQRVAEMIREARTQVWLKGPAAVIARHSDALDSAAKRGVRIVAVVFGDAYAIAQAAFAKNSKLYMHEGSGEVLATGNRQFVIAVDFKQTLIADFGERAEGMYTRSSGMVFLADTMIRHEIYLAEIITAFGPQIEARFGHGLSKLRATLLPPELAVEFGRNVAKALPAKKRAK